MIEQREMNGIAIVELARGKANALDTGFLGELTRTFKELRADAPRGVILTASGSIFCAGLDLPGLLGADTEDLAELLEALYGTLREIFSFPHPVVAAINGHALAGGALLTLACDQRLMVMGDGKWGLTEAQLGLTVPASMIEMARYSLSRPVLEKLLYGGQAYPAFKAREMAVLDDLVEVDALLEHAGEEIEAWTPHAAAFGDIKRRLKAPALAAMDAAVGGDADWIELWSSDRVRSRVQAAVEGLGKRKAGS